MHPHKKIIHTDVCVSAQRKQTYEVSASVNENENGEEAATVIESGAANVPRIHRTYEIIRICVSVCAKKTYEVSASESESASENENDGEEATAIESGAANEPVAAVRCVCQTHKNKYKQTPLI